MNDKNNNHDLFSASLESIETSKRVEKFQRFKNDFQRECNATLDNAQEWIKAELPIVTDYIDATAIKDELKQTKTSNRRKHLLSALLFEKNLRESIVSNDATTAAIMAMHMFNNMWQAKVELHGSLPTAAASTNTSPPKLPSEISNKTYNDTSEKILTTLIKKGEQLKNDSQIQSRIQNKPQNKVTPRKPKQKTQPTIKKASGKNTKKKSDSWAEEIDKEKQRKLNALANENKIKENAKKKVGGLISRVKTKLPLNRRKKSIADKFTAKQDDPTEKYQDDDLFEDPNRSAIMVNPGFSDNIDDSLIQARSQIMQKPDESGVTMHKFLKERDHEKQNPGSNTIIMKLASSSGRRPGTELSVPEQCQQTINILTQQFPGYDQVAIRHMAAEKVGVSPQYIENLNILPEKTG